MDASPVTPQRLSQSSRYPFSPISPATVQGTKRRRSAFLEAPHPWISQPLTPPFDNDGADTDAAITNEPDNSATKRACTEREYTDTNDVFAAITKSIRSPAYPNLDDPHFDDSALIGAESLVCSPAPQDEARVTCPSIFLSDSSGSDHNNVYDNQALDSILTTRIPQSYDYETDCLENFDVLELYTDEVCFGMISVDSFALSPDLNFTTVPQNIHVFNNLRLSEIGNVSYDESGLIIEAGKIGQRMLNILLRLSDIPGVSAQLRCVITLSPRTSKKRHVATTDTTWTANLFAIIYGPFSVFDTIGDFLEQCDICIQDPQGCDRNVRYRNPHRYSGLDQDAPMTIDKELTLKATMYQRTEESLELFNDSATKGNLPSISTPAALSSQMFPYQQQALYFMQQRERGWSFDGCLDDIWTVFDIGGSSMYLNTITDEAQLSKPPDFRGGLLADQMGLGKTLSIISLIASDLEHVSHSSEVDRHSSTIFSSHYSKCTLVIVPPNLLDTWDDQLRQHCRPGMLRWSKHHGKHRFMRIAELAPYNVILTTYNLVATEWRNHKSSSILYSTDWHRIVLDEAHYIREERNQMARAICDLKASRRWAVTGTPVQNRLTDLEALLKFLRVHPYDEHGNFEQDILNFWKVDPKAAIARLKKLISCISLRRTSDTIRLPKRTDLLFTLSFGVEERELYDSVEKKVWNMLKQAEFHQRARIGMSRDVLHGIQLLRSICNFGTLADTARFQKVQTETAAWSVLDAHCTLDELSASGDTRCASCEEDVTALNNALNTKEAEVLDFASSQIMVSQCQQLLCGNCVYDIQQSGVSLTNWCEHVPSCPTFSISGSSPIGPASTSPDQIPINLQELPTKIKALVDDISIHSASKCVVFSAWRTTLNLADRALTAAGIKTIRFDGEVKGSDRTTARQQFDADPSIKVMLITISCGAVGLDLTAADRAYIMEPQWNPTIEDQALARIHRMGQRNPVTTIRFVVADTIEQRVVEVQKRKKSFADILLTSKRGAPTADQGLYSFESLRSLLR